VRRPGNVRRDHRHGQYNYTHSMVVITAQRHAHTDTPGKQHFSRCAGFNSLANTGPLQPCGPSFHHPWVPFRLCLLHPLLASSLARRASPTTCTTHAGSGSLASIYESLWAEGKAARRTDELSFGPNESSCNRRAAIITIRPGVMYFHTVQV
jgi:hypothetical protein